MGFSKKNLNIKNYIILLVIMIITFLITFYILAWYKNYNDYKLGIPVLEDVVAEVKYQDLDAFLSERDVTVIYMCTVNENICRNFEKKFKSYIINNNLRDDIFYFNLNEYEDKSIFLSNFYKKYKSDSLIKKIDDYPVIVVFNHNKIIDVLSSDAKSNITVEQAKNFLADYIDLL